MIPIIIRMLFCVSIARKNGRRISKTRTKIRYDRRGRHRHRLGSSPIPYFITGTYPDERYTGHFLPG